MELTYPFDAALVLQKKRAIKKALLEQSGLIDKKIAILSGGTVGELTPMLELFLLLCGIRPIFWQGGYGLYYENLLFDDGSLAEFSPDVIYIHISSRNLRFWPKPTNSEEEAEKKLEKEFEHYKTVLKAAQKFACPVIINNFEEPGFRSFGNMDAWDVRGRVLYTRRINEKLAQYIKGEKNTYIHDFAWLAAINGIDNFCDNAAYYAYKYLCAPSFVPNLAHSIASLILAIFGRTKKCIVCDLDNTLWGGVVGEEGAEGISIGNESPEGMAYTALGEYLAMLSSRGVLLAVASKNEPENAEAGLARSESPLKRGDFLAFEVNWQPKSESVQKIAGQLNIGTDSMVLIDDNPAEREEVNRALPMVETPPIAEPEDSVNLLSRSGWFETVSLSADDIARSGMYKSNAKRQEQQGNFADYTEYLKSLEMTAEILPFKIRTIERVTQLINKTNQFNLTTRRYSAAQVQKCMQDSKAITLSGRLCDKFGDNGITSALIAHIHAKKATIDLWVMSCRVFKRNLEYAMFDALVDECKKCGITTITGTWLPSAKNLFTKDFYATIGFELVEETADKRVFTYTIPQNYKKLNEVITIG